MTLKCNFMLKFVFIVGLTRYFCFIFEDKCVKMNVDTHIPSATKIGMVS